MKGGGFETMLRIITMCVLVFLIIITILGCNRQVSRLSIASTENVDISRTHERIAENKTEREGRIWILFLPLRRQPTVERSLRKLLSKNAADYATNVKVTEGGWSLILISRGYARVQGDLWAAK